MIIKSSAGSPAPALLREIDFSPSKQTVITQEHLILGFYPSYLQIQYKYIIMYWMLRNLRFFLFASAMAFVTANDQYRTEEKIQCKTEVNIHGMALKRSVFKRWSVAAPHLCDVKCGQEITCQSYNYNKKYQICELNNRTKEARPENFLLAPTWFYIRRLNGRGKKSEDYIPM